MPLKVLILVRRLDRGGAEMLECRLAGELSKLGYQTFIGAQYTSGVFDGYERKSFWISKGVKDVFFLNSIGTTGILSAILNIWRLQSKHKFDAIITSNTGLSSIVSLASCFKKIHHIAAFHDYLTPQKETALRIKVWKRLIGSIEKGYAITGYVRDNITAYIPALRDKVTVIYNSIDSVLKSHAPNTNLKMELGLDQNSRILLYVGRLNYRKGLDIAIDYLGDRLAAWNAHVVIVGDKIDARNLEYGKLNYNSLLTKKIKETGNESRFHFLGFRSDVMQIMEQSDLLVHLARHEGFGLIFLEAFKARLPILASHVGGIPEVLKDTPYNAVNIDNKEEILRQVEYLLGLDTDARSAVTEKAFLKLSFFSDARRAKEVDALIRS